MSSLTNIQTSVVRVPATTLVPDKIAALAAAAAALASEQAAAADRVQTGLDRTATGEDAAATGADRVQTGLDRTATGQAAAATAADRVQTGLDRTAVANDKDTVAADKAIVAQDKQSVAEDREAVESERAIVADLHAATETFRNEAEQFRDQSGADRTAAEGAMDAAEGFRDEAQGFRDTASGHKDTAQTAATTSSTQASVATTQAATATTQAGTATTKASEAAAAAATALNAIALSFKGGVAGASVPATSSLAGDWYRITTAGTSQSKTWAVGDIAIYNGTSGQWTQIAGNVPSEDRTLRGDMMRRIADALFFSSPGTERCVYTPLGTAGTGVGASDFTLLFPFRVPRTDDSLNRRPIGGLSSVNTNTDVTDGLEISIETNGDLRIASGATVLTYGGFRNPRTGEDGVLAVVRSVTAGITVYWNGVALAITAGSASSLNAVSFTNAFLIQGARSTTERFVGRMGPALLINYPLGAADVLFHAQTGQLPNLIELSRGQGAAVFTSDFSANTTGWAGANGGTIAAVGGRMEVTVGANAQHGVQRTSSPYITGFADGQFYRLRFTYRLKSGSAGAGWSLGNSTSNASWHTIAALSGATISNVGSFFFTPTGVDQTADVILRWNNTENAGFWFFNGSAAAGVVEFVGVTFTPVGLLARPAIRSGRMMPDLSGNQNHAVLTRGVSPLTEDANGVVVARGLTANGEFIDTSGTVPTDSALESVVVRNTSANAVTGFVISTATGGGGTVICAATNIPGNSTVVMPLTQPAMSVLTAGSFVPLGRLYYAATTWNSGSLNVSIRYRRERGI
ncbi:MAG: hypothetical protein Q8M02_10235 [Candidatus Didemnitutus sp.]|nr:hypothetical protein [Candidatus Didemnitutus sp.]